jgi:hypothetical protein
MALPFVAKVPWLNTYAPSHVSSLIFFFFKLFKKTLLLQGQRCVLSRKFKPGTFLNIYGFCYLFCSVEKNYYLKIHLWKSKPERLLFMYNKS